MVAVARSAPAPSAKHLRHWEAVCRFIDAQPYRAVWYPFPYGEGDPPMTSRLLRRMERFKLIQHGQDCCWKLTRRWEAVMKRLWSDLPDEEDSDDQPAPSSGTPFVVDTGVDTLYVSLLADELSAHLLDACIDFKTLAQGQDQTVETPWCWFGAPLSMYKMGVGTKEHGKGASWGFILRNEYVELLLRKSPLNGIIGSVRLSAKALWTWGPRGALDEMRVSVRRMWMAPKDFAQVRYQLSQIHLCADIAHFTPQPADLQRLVTRARVRDVHIPSEDDEMVGWSVPDGDDDDDDPLYAWDIDEAPDDVPDVADEDDDDTDDEATHAPLEEMADSQGASVYLWGERASGMHFAHKGALSVVFYDKALQERLGGPKLAWMPPIHEAGGWNKGMPLTRIEARFKREVLRELAREQGHDPSWFDDPWQALERLQSLWAYFAGLPPEHDLAPDSTGRGWMRLTVPNEGDSLKRRWPTDPLWHLVQRAPFSDQPPVMLKRKKHHAPELEAIDAQIYGFLKLRGAYRGEYLSHTVSLSQELHDFYDRMEETDDDKGRDFADEVREKARMMGKPVPMRPLSTLPPISERPKQTRKGKQNAS